MEKKQQHRQILEQVYLGINHPNPLNPSPTYNSKGNSSINGNNNYSMPPPMDRNNSNVNYSLT